MRSDTIKQGDARAAHRSLLRATGVGEGDWDKPFIAICNSHVDIIPGHVHLQAVGNYVKECVRAAGGVPFLFNTIGVDDGIAMGHDGMKFSLPSRELIADSVETMIQAHCFDAMICIPNCDKIVPGMFMGAMRVNVPTIFVSGGPMEAGTHRVGQDRRPDRRVRRGRAEAERQALGRGPRGDREGRLPDLRKLLGDVHRQQHELPGRGHRHGTAGQRHDPGDLGRSQGAVRTRGEPDRGDGPGVRQARPGSWPPASRDRHTGGLRQRDDPRHGDGREHQHRPPYPGDRTRGGRAVHARADRRAQQANAQPLQGQPVEPLSHRGRRPRRGHPHDPGRGRAGLSRSAGSDLHHRHRQDPGREHRGVRRPRRDRGRRGPVVDARPRRAASAPARRGPCPASPPRPARRPPGWPCSKPRARRARSSRWQRQRSKRFQSVRPTTVPATTVSTRST